MIRIIGKPYINIICRRQADFLATKRQTFTTIMELVKLPHECRLPGSRSRTGGAPPAVRKVESCDENTTCIRYLEVTDKNDK